MKGPPILCHSTTLACFMWETKNSSRQNYRICRSFRCRRGKKLFARTNFRNINYCVSSSCTNSAFMRVLFLAHSRRCITLQHWPGLFFIFVYTVHGFIRSSWLEKRIILYFSVEKFHKLFIFFFLLFLHFGTNLEYFLFRPTLNHKLIYFTKFLRAEWSEQLSIDIYRYTSIEHPFMFLISAFVFYPPYCSIPIRHISQALHNIVEGNWKSQNTSSSYIPIQMLNIPWSIKIAETSFADHIQQHQTNNNYTASMRTSSAMK